MSRGDTARALEAAIRSKIVDRRTAVERVTAWRDGEGLEVAFANGLFDLLHVGHLRYLIGARAEGDRLVVGLNSDACARRLKGPSRPIVPQDERAELLAGLGCVDLITVFDEPTVEPLLRALCPSVHCKGTDYTVDTVPEKPVADSLGIRIAIVGDPKDHATTDVVRKIRELGET